MIVILFWFVVSLAGENTTITHQFTSLEDCRTAGDYLNARDSKALAAKEIGNYGGQCYEVLQPKRDSI